MISQETREIIKEALVKDYYQKACDSGVFTPSASHVRSANQSQIHAYMKLLESAVNSALEDNLDEIDIEVENTANPSNAHPLLTTKAVDLYNEDGSESSNPFSWEHIETIKKEQEKSHEDRS